MNLKFKFSISVKLFLAFTLLAIIPIIGIGLFNYTYFNNYSINANIKTIDIYNEQTSKMLSDIGFEIITAFTNIVSSEVFSSSIEYNTLELASSHLNELTATSKFFNYYLLLNAKGEIIGANTDGFSNNFDIDYETELKGETYSWVQDQILDQYLVFSKRDKFDIANKATLNTFFLSSPIINSEDQTSGYLVAFFDWNLILKIMEKQKEKMVDRGFKASGVCLLNTNDDIVAFDSFFINKEQTLDHKSLTTKNPIVKMDGSKWYASESKVVFGVNEFFIINFLSDKEVKNASLVMLKILGFSVLALLIFVITVGTYIAKSIITPIRNLITLLRDIAEGEGDLTKELAVNTNDELADIAFWFNKFITRLKELLMQIKKDIQLLEGVTNKLTNMSEHISKLGKSQVDVISGMVAGIQESSASLNEISQTAEQSYLTSEQASENASQSGTTINEMISNIEKIAQSMTFSSEKITQLIELNKKISSSIQVINDITDQTNLLALNAAIEAARAGKHGKGFAVVSNEVRKLSQKTYKSANEITNLIKQMSEQSDEVITSMDQGVLITSKSGENSQQAKISLEDILNFISDNANRIKDISVVVAEQVKVSEQINTAADDVSTAAKDVDNAGDQLEHMVNELKVSTDSLANMANKFKLQ